MFVDNKSFTVFSPDDAGSGGGSMPSSGIPPSPTPTVVASAPAAEPTDTGGGASTTFSINNAVGTFDDIPRADFDGPADLDPTPIVAPVVDPVDAVKPVVEGDPKPDAPVTTTDAPVVAPVVAEAPLPIPDNVAAILKAAADALGINETDPAKLQEAIAARHAETVAEQARQREAAALTFEQKAVEQIQERARMDVIGLLNPIIKGELRNENFDIDNAPDNWWDSTHANYDPQMAIRYNQIFSELRVQPQYENAYVNAYTGYKTQYDGEKARISELSKKYPNHAATLVSDLRQHGMSADGLERIAAMTHEQVTSALATHNSTSEAERAELTTLREKVSGYDTALATARAEGLAEGQKAALAVIQAGNSIPSTVGIGGTQGTTNAFSVLNSGRLQMSDIPVAGANF